MMSLFGLAGPEESGIDTQKKCGGSSACSNSSDVAFDEPSTEAASSSGGQDLLDIDMPHSEWILPRDILEYEPKVDDIFRGGKTSSPAARCIFTGAALLEDEAAALRELRKALDGDGDDIPHVSLDPKGPCALRALQQCENDVPATLEMLTAMSEARAAQIVPNPGDLFEDLERGFIYWHGR